MSDPYLTPEGVLRNKLGIEDQAELAEAEALFAAVGEAELLRRSPSSQFNFRLLCRIHEILFERVYDWAGHPRTVGLAKMDFTGEGGRPVQFTSPDRIAVDAKALMRHIQMLASGRRRTATEFAEAAAPLFVALNNIHPFREGNGRTQRLLFRAVATAAGHTLAWDVITSERMIAASVAGARGDREPMKRVFREVIDPDRVRALREAVRFLSGTKVAWNDLYLATTGAGERYRGVLVRRMSPEFLMRVKSERGDWLAVGKEEDLPPEAGQSQEIEIRTRRW